MRPATKEIDHDERPLDRSPSPCRRCRLCALVGVRRRAADKLEYNRDIRPILAENCFACHGPDSAARKADLRLDQRDDGRRGRRPSCPGKPDESELIDRIFSDDPTELMPPPKSHKKLTAAQKETLKRWIAEGAEYQPHWSFIAPQRPDAAGGQERGLGPQPDRPLRPGRAGEPRACSPRPRPTAARWPAALSLDLTGLPPAPADVEAFVNDTVARRLREATSTSCWRRRTGASTAAATGSTPPATPTRTASTSTTSARCGRTATGSSTPSTATMPFDQFTIEQLAGDLLPEPRRSTSRSPPASTAATSPPTKAASIDEEYLVLYARDRTETIVAGLAGPDGRLRRLPRPQVRPAHAEGVLRAGGVLQQHDAGGDGRQHQGHAADHRRAAAGGPRRAGRRSTSELAAAQAQVEARKQAAAAGLRRVAGRRPSRATLGRRLRRRTAAARRRSTRARARRCT